MYQYKQMVMEQWAALLDSSRMITLSSSTAPPHPTPSQSHKALELVNGIFLIGPGLRIFWAKQALDC